MNKLPKQYTFLNDLVGKQLGSVVFVQDYFQLVFDGPSISIYSESTSVFTKRTESTSWENQFRNILCDQISKIVKKVTFVPEIELTITFRDKSKIVVSLHPDDQICPEAIFCFGFS